MLSSLLAILGALALTWFCSSVQAALDRRDNHRLFPRAALANVSFDTFSNDDISVVAVYSNVTGIATFILQSSYVGWVGVGVGGTTMCNATLYVAWPNNSSKSRQPAVVSQHKCANGGWPPVVPSVNLKALAIIPSSVNRLPSDLGGAVSVAFSVPLTLGDAAAGFVYAVSKAPPASPTNASSTFSYHDKRGTFNLNLTNFIQGSLPPPVTTLYLPQKGPNLTATPLPVIVRKGCILDGTLCLTATRDASNPYFITLTVESGLGGWVAVGLGANMTKTTMYVGWESSAGTMMVSQRFALGHGIPSLSPTQTFDLVDTPPGVAILASTNLAFTVRLPASGVERFNVSESGPTSFILGSSSWPPLFRDSPTAKFTRHEARGPLQLDLSFPADVWAAIAAASSSSTAAALPSPSISPPASFGTLTPTPTASNAPPPPASIEQTSAAPSASSSAVVVPKCSDAANNYCVTVQADVAAGTALVTVQAVVPNGGWAALGIGSSVMAGSTMYVAWKNSSGGVVISQRKAAGHIPPSFVTSPWDFTPAVARPLPPSSLSADSSGTANTATSLVFALLRPLAGAGTAEISLSEPTKIIWGVGDSVLQPNLATSQFSMHSKKGAFVLDLSAVSGVGKTTSVASAVQLVPATEARFCSDSNNTVCASFVPDLASGTVTVTLQSSSTGWAGVGVSTGGMLTGPLFLCWKNSTGGVLVSQRATDKYGPPSVAAAPGFVQLSKAPASVAIFPTSLVVCTFQLPIKGDATKGTKPLSISGGTTDNVWAYNPTPPTNPNSADSPIAMHVDRGFAQVELMVPQTITISGATKTSNIKATTTRKTTAKKSIMPTANARQGSDQNLFCVDTEGTLCISTFTNRSFPAGQGTVVITVQSSALSWAALGVDPTGAGLMKSSTFYVGWPSPDGNVTLSQRVIRTSAASHAMPIFVDSQPAFTQLYAPAPGTPIQAQTKIIFSFSRPLTGDATTAAIQRDGATTFVFASSSGGDGAVADPTSPSSAFSKHDVYGVFAVDVSSDGTLAPDALLAAAAASSAETAAARARALRRAHGACMTAAWAGVPPAAVFLARYMKSRLGHLWFRAHVALFVYVAGGLTVAGLACIEAEVARWGGTAPGTALVNSPHGAVGAVLAVALFPLQIALGAASNWLWSPDRSAVPWWDRLHWWVGRLASLWGLVAIVMGVLEYGGSTVWLAVVGAYVGCWAVAFALAEMYWGADHHLAAAPPEKTSADSGCGLNKESGEVSF